MDLLNNFLRFFLPFLVLVLTGAVYTYSEETARERDRALSNLQERAIIGTAALNRGLENAALDLHVLTELAELTGAFNAPTPENQQRVERAFLVFSRNKGIYDQIRWIDEKGQERIRVNHDSKDAYLVATRHLQNKSGRYYFENTLTLGKNQFFISPLDLNVEQGKVERPLKPVIRIGTPVFDHRGNRRGILLLNYSGNDLLERFIADQPEGTGTVELLNQDGYWLYSNVPSQAWGFMLNRPDTYASLYPQSWPEIQAKAQGQLVNDEGGFVFQTVEPPRQIARRWASPGSGADTDSEHRPFTWKVVAHIEPQTLQAIEINALFRVTTITSLLLLMGILGSLIYSRTQQSQARMLADTHRLSERETLLTRLGEGVFGLNIQGNCTFVNPKACELLGYEKDELINAPVLQRLSEQLTLSSVMRTDTSPAADSARTVETRLTRKNGEVFDAYLMISPIYGKRGEQNGCVIAFQDVSDRKRSEQELQQAMVALDNEHQFMKTLIGTLPDMVWMKDTQGHYLTCNPEFERFIGARESCIIGKTDYDLVAEELADYFRASDQQTIREGRAIVMQEWLDHRADNQRVLRQTTKTPMRDNRGRIIGVLGIGHDITELKEAEQRLLLQAQVLDQIQDHVTVTDLDGRIIYINAAQADELGHCKERMIGHRVSVLGHKPEADMSQEDIILQTQNKGEWQGEIIHQSRHGIRKYMDLRTTLVIDDTHKPIAMVGISTDITERKRYQRQLERIAHFDPLTNLPNRVLLEDRFQQAMAQTLRHGNYLAVVYIDLDGFKAVNDSFGHSQGDYLLKQLGQQMKSALREGDTLARIGGDEFVALLLDLPDQDKAIPVLERLLSEASEPVMSGEHLLQVSASIGVTFFPHGDERDTDHLITLADHAMYKAKELGKNRYFIHDQVSPGFDLPAAQELTT